MPTMNLAPREKRLVSVMFVVMIAIAVIPVYRNITSRHATSVEQLAQADSRLESARVLQDAIINAREGQRVIQEKLRARPRNFDLYNFAQQSVRRVNLNGRADLQSKDLASKEGAFGGVQITLRNVSMKEIIDLMHGLYASNNLILMQRLTYLKPSPDGKGLECAVVMISPKR
ncbi:MAG: hypothetical protein VCD00_20205 [Candidatus Hydrogenedentota bacterium]